jgi:polyisoprenoid-binding protein YceI
MRNYKGSSQIFRITVSLLLLLNILAPNNILKAVAGGHAMDSVGSYESSGNLSKAPESLQYKIDPGRSKFIVRALVGGLLSSFGHNHTIAIGDFTGNASLTLNSIEPASLQITIKADSLAVMDKVSDKDKNEIETKMRNDVLETGTYPYIVFQSTKISASKTAEGQKDIQIWGDVTLHGVTKSIWFKGQMTMSGNTLRSKGEFALRQSEFKIKPVSVAGGTIKVKDELKFSFDIVAMKSN